MDQEEKDAIVAACTRFLGGHGRRSVQDQLSEIAASSYAKTRSDHYGQGGLIAEFEAELAELFGKEAAVFMPSGTMAQQIALRIWSDRAECRRVAFHPTCHLEIHEQSAYRQLHHLEATLLGAPDRLFTRDDLAACSDPISTLLIELPQRKIGGQLPSWDELDGVCDLARVKGMKLHMDGARLWECAPFYGRSYREIAAPFDSVYASFYKILGGLPGAVLAGPAEFINEARIWQRRHGGNLYQMSPKVISAKIGMDKHLARIPDYVAKAQEIAGVLEQIEGITLIPGQPQVNMMHVYLRGDREALIDAAFRVAKEDKLLLFNWLVPTSQGNKFELTIGAAALDVPTDEIAAAFSKVFEYASLEQAAVVG